MGWRVRVFERATSGLESRGTAIVTHDGLFVAFARAGVRIDEIGMQLRGRTAFSRDGLQLAHFSYNQVLCAWSTLYRRLLEAVPPECYELGREVVDVEDRMDSVQIRFADGTQAHGDLLIGADGIWSKVRGAVNPNEAPLYCGYIGWRGLLDETVMSESFREVHAPVISVFVEPSGQLLVYTLAGADDSLQPGRRRFGFLWYHTMDESGLPALLTDTDGHYNGRWISPARIQPHLIERMRRQAAERLPPNLAPVVQLSPNPFVQPIFDLASKRIAFKRTAIIGDAAFVVRPHVGAGVLKAADDAVALADAIAQERTIDGALRRYEAERVPRGSRLVEQGRHLGSDLQRPSRSGAPALSVEEIIRELGRVELLHAS